MSQELLVPLSPWEEIPLEEKANTERAGPGLEKSQLLVSSHDYLAHPGLRPPCCGSLRSLCTR